MLASTASVAVVVVGDGTRGISRIGVLIHALFGDSRKFIAEGSFRFKLARRELNNSIAADRLAPAALAVRRGEAGSSLEVDSGNSMEEESVEEKEGLKEAAAVTTAATRDGERVLTVDVPLRPFRLNGLLNGLLTGLFC